MFTNNKVTVVLTHFGYLLPACIINAAGVLLSKKTVNNSIRLPPEYQFMSRENTLSNDAEKVRAVLSTVISLLV